MSYGLEIRKANGSKLFSTDDSTWNYVGHFVAPAGQSITKTFPSLALASEVITQRSFVGNPPDNQEAIIHEVAPLSGNQVRAYGGSVSTLVVVLAR